MTQFWKWANDPVELPRWEFVSMIVLLLVFSLRAWLQ